MQHLRSRGFTRVIFERDCKLLVDILAGKTMRFDIINWIYEMKAWERRFEAVEFVWNPRTANQPADKLAKTQRSRDSDFNFYFYVPTCIPDLLHSD